MPNNSHNEIRDIPNLLSVRSFCQKYPEFRPGGVRHLLFTLPDGFEICVRRVGRRVLLDEKLFIVWIEKLNYPNSKQALTPDEKAG